MQFKGVVVINFVVVVTGVCRSRYLAFQCAVVGRGKVTWELMMIMLSAEYAESLSRCCFNVCHTYYSDLLVLYTEFFLKFPTTPIIKLIIQACR